jgi:hypothetical protein
MLSMAATGRSHYAVRIFGVSITGFACVRAVPHEWIHPEQGPVSDIWYSPAFEDNERLKGVLAMLSEWYIAVTCRHSSGTRLIQVRPPKGCEEPEGVGSG